LIAVSINHIRFSLIVEGIVLFDFVPNYLLLSGICWIHVVAGNFGEKFVI